MSTPVSRAAALLRTLSDETRLQMLSLLRRREFCVCELVDLFPISQPAVSGHLRRLKDAGLVEDDRRGMWVYYRACETIPPLVQAILGEVGLPPDLEAALGAPQQSACCDAESQMLDGPEREARSEGHDPAARRPPRRREAVQDATQRRVPG